MPQAQKGSYGRIASRLGRDPWERQGGQAREWDAVQLPSQAELHRWSGLCMALLQ